MRGISIVLTGAALCATAPVLAQSWSDVRDGQLAAGGAVFAEEGYEPNGFLHDGSMDDGDSDLVTVPLRANTDTVLVGVCDLDCEDLDLIVYDPNGQRVEEDVATDDVPIVIFTPRRTGNYRVTMQMIECTSEPCSYSLQVLTR